MTINVLSKEQLGVQLGYLDTEGNPSIRGIASILRATLCRWGLSPKRTVLKYARNELRSCGIEDVSKVPRVLQRLIDYGECDAVFIGNEPYIAPSTPRWISVGNGISSFLGTPNPPEEFILMDDDHNSIIRRIRVNTEEDVELLEIAGVQEISLDEWLLPPGYAQHLSRRARKPVRNDTISLSSFWDTLTIAMTDDGLPLGPDAEVRFLGGSPGPDTYFGKYNSPSPEGRWVSDPGEGQWCAYRQGYGDGHWHPCIVSVTRIGRRVLDLYDNDEWQWAVLARGRNTESCEVVKRSGEHIVNLTFQPPSQLSAVLDILGKSCGPWKWEMYTDFPDMRQLYI